MQKKRTHASIAMLIDDILIGADLRDSLESLGHTVTRTVTEPAEAFSIAPGVEVLLVDLEIRGEMDVLQVGKQIASDGVARVVYLADNDGQVARVKREAPESGWVKWPFNPADLDRAIRLALEAGAVRASAVEAQPF